jgi:hypothetical protein
MGGAVAGVAGAATVCTRTCSGAAVGRASGAVGTWTVAAGVVAGVVADGAGRAASSSGATVVWALAGGITTDVLANQTQANADMTAKRNPNRMIDAFDTTNWNTDPGSRETGARTRGLGHWGPIHWGPRHGANAGTSRHIRSNVTHPEFNKLRRGRRKAGRADYFSPTALSNGLLPKVWAGRE